MKLFQLKLIASLIVILQFIYIEEFFSIVPWLLFYFLGIRVSLIISKNERSRELFSIFYLIFSVIGLTICIDNYNNFSSLSGFAMDDLKFFESTLYLIQEGPKPDFEISFFSYSLVPMAYVISVFKEVSIADLLPFNWFFSGLIAVLLNKLCNGFIGRDIPLFLFIASYSLCFSITDSFSRLYRDGMLIFFMLIVVSFIEQKKYTKSILYSIPVLLLRIANMVIPIVYAAAKRLGFKKKRIVFSVVIISSVLVITFLPNVLKFAMMYGSDTSRIDRYESAFSSLSSQEVLDSRFKENQSTSNSLMAQAYSEVSVTSIGIRAMFAYFFPLTFRGPDSIITHARLGKVEGIYFYNVINTLNTLSLIIVFPFIVVGILYNKNPAINSIIITQLIFLMLVLLISGQTRHFIGVFVFNAIIVANGYYLFKELRKARVLVYSLVILTTLLIGGYNLI